MYDTLTGPGMATYCFHRKQGMSCFFGKTTLFFHVWFTAGATRVAYSDARSTGYGGYAVELGREIARGQWCEADATLNSSWHVLKAVYVVLESFAQQLHGWFTDNQLCPMVARRCIYRMEIFDETCMKHALKLEMPRSQNDRDDYISQIVNPCLFAQLDTFWGPYSVACFVSLHPSSLVFGPRWSTLQTSVPWCMDFGDLFRPRWSGVRNSVVWDSDLISLLFGLMFGPRWSGVRAVMVIRLGPEWSGG